MADPKAEGAVSAEKTAKELIVKAMEQLSGVTMGNVAPVAYAVAFLIDAIEASDGPITLGEVARRESAAFARGVEATKGTVRMMMADGEELDGLNLGTLAKRIRALKVEDK